MPVRMLDCVSRGLAGCDLHRDEMQTRTHCAPGRQRRRLAPPKQDARILIRNRTLDSPRRDRDGGDPGGSRRAAAGAAAPPEPSGRRVFVSPRRFRPGRGDAPCPRSPPSPDASTASPSRSLRARKRRGERITMLTAYDFTFASLFDQAGIDVLLVGDSLGNVVQGQRHDAPGHARRDDLPHAPGRARRAPRARRRRSPLRLLSDHLGGRPAQRRALREGGRRPRGQARGRPKRRRETIARIVAAEIPVMGHVGLTPQAIHRMGGHRVQGRGESGRARVLDDARAVEAAGAFAVVLEGMPAELGRRDHARARRFRPSASAPGSTATARCW